MSFASRARGLAVVLLLALFLLAACGDEVAPTPIIGQPTATTAPSEATATTAAPDTATPNQPAATATTAPDSTSGGNKATPSVASTQAAPPSPTSAPPTPTMPTLPTVTPVPPATSGRTTPPSPSPSPKPVIAAGDWKPANPGVGDLFVLASDPVAANVVYAGGTGGFARSDDGGQTWKGLNRDFQVRQIAVAPSDTRIIYAGTREGCASGEEGTLYRSADGGLTWKPVTGGPYSIDVNPTDPDRLVALRCDGVYRSTDGGVNWDKLPGSGITNLDGFQMARGVDDRTVIYVTYVAEGGGAQIQRTLDDARTWQVLETPDFELPSDLKVDPFDARHVYFVGGTGFYSSANAGQSFNAHSEGLAEDAQSALSLGDLVLDLISPPPAGAKYSLFLSQFSSQGSASIMRWNGNDSWEEFAEAPGSGQDVGQLLIVNDAKAPALLMIGEQQVFRLGIGR